MANDSIFPIEKMCKVLRVSRSSYYCWLIHEPGKRDIENDDLSDRIKRIYKTSKKTYGSPRVTIALLEEGIHVSSIKTKSSSINEEAKPTEYHT